MADAGGTPIADLFRRVVEVAHEAVGMDVAWVSEFTDGMQVLRQVAGDGDRFGIGVGTATPLAGSYCARVVDGRLPAAIPDTSRNETTASLPITDDVGIGSYVGVPVRLPDGGVYGMLCCVSRDRTEHLSESDVRLLTVLAEAATEEAIRIAEIDRRRRDVRSAVLDVLDTGRITIVVQPIVSLRSMSLVGGEALARFHDHRRPDIWFNEAATVGLSTELDLLAIRSAFRLLTEMPPTSYLSVNASPATILSPDFAAALRTTAVDRVVVEITEHAPIPDYDALHGALGPLRAAGMLLAVDDAGAGYASFRHILALRPDIIKLDRSLTDRLDTDPVKRALAIALTSFAHDLGARIVAEGVETQGELDALARLDIDAAQGYFLARPGPVPPPTVTARPSVQQLRRLDSNLSGLGRDEAPSFDDFITILLKRVADLTGFDVTYLTLHRGDALTFAYVAGSGEPAFPYRRGASRPWEDSLCEQAIRHGMLWTADVTAELKPDEEYVAWGINSFISVPIVDDSGNAVSSLCGASRRHLYLSDRTVIQLQLFARMIADRLRVEGGAPGGEGTP